jgi:hypothetical protein
LEHHLGVHRSARSRQWMGEYNGDTRGAEGHIDERL